MYFVFAAMFRREGVVRRSLRIGGSVDPSIDATRTKNGIGKEDEVTNEYIKFSIVRHMYRRSLTSYQQSQLADLRDVSFIGLQNQG